MTVFSSPSFDHHEMVVFREDSATGLRAIIAVHNTNLGPALGGCRMYPYSSDEAALEDVLRLSRGMTYKSALAGLPLGGGKSVIIGDPARQKSRELLLAMGEFIDSLGGKYISAEDSGTGVADIRVMGERTPHLSGLEEGGEHDGDPSPHTAYGVFKGIEAAVKYRFNSDAMAGAKVAVQGFGHVGYHLAKYLTQHGAKLIGYDVNDGNLQRVVDEFGVVPVAADQIFSADVDVIAPCALGGCINDESIQRIKAPIVAGAANNQLLRQEHGEALRQKGVLYAPDFVINAGGVIDVHYQRVGKDRQRVTQLVENIGNTVATIFERAAVEKKATNVIAEDIAREIFSAACEKAA